MATLSSDKAVRASTIRGIDVPSLSASQYFTVPDDFAEEVEAALEARPDAPSVTVHGYDRAHPFVGTLDPGLLATGRTITANRAHFIAFYVRVQQTVASAHIITTASSGNLDIGIYDSLGNRLVSTGSVTTPAANQWNTIALTSSLTLVPGVKYFAAFGSSDAGTQPLGLSTSSVGNANTAAGNLGLGYFVNSSFPLPASVAYSAGTGYANAVGIWFS